MLRVSGYGQSGPYRDRPGFGVVAEAMGGLRHLTAEPGRVPVRVGVSMGDTLAALHGERGEGMTAHAAIQRGSELAPDADATRRVVDALAAGLAYAHARRRKVLMAVNTYPQAGSWARWTAAARASSLTGLVLSLSLSSSRSSLPITTKLPHPGGPPLPGDLTPRPPPAARGTRSTDRCSEQPRRRWSPP